MQDEGIKTRRKPEAIFTLGWQTSAEMDAWLPHMATSLPVGSARSPFLGFRLDSISQPGNNTSWMLVKTSAVGDYRLSKCTVLISVTVHDFAECRSKKQELAVSKNRN